VTVEVRPVSGRRDRRRFLDLPWRLHHANAAFVPQLDFAVAALLDRRRNPFWHQARGCEWLAFRDGAVVGRVGACRDEALFLRADGCGAVGFWDAEDDAEVADALFKTAEAWLAAEGCTRARGPLNYSIHDTAALLVEGYDTPPTIDTTWNPPYYPSRWEAAGWRGAQDMLAFQGQGNQPPERALRFGERVRKRGVVVRPLDFDRFDEEVRRLHRVFNEAWDDNWGHVPISYEEFAFKAKDMKSIVDPDLIRVAENNGRPVGILVGLPDINAGIRRARGRLLPFGWFHVLRERKRTQRARAVVLGVIPGYRQRGVEAAILADSYSHSRYPWAEASWVLADNAPMVNALALYGLHPYKRWRMYEKTLAPTR